VIDAENLTKKFGNLTAVEDLTLHVDEGEVFGFLGPIGLFTVMIVSSIVSSMPNEVILGFAGMTMSPMSVAAFGALGSTVGGVLCFYIAGLGGRPLAEKFVDKLNQLIQKAKNREIKERIMRNKVKRKIKRKSNEVPASSYVTVPYYFPTEQVDIVNKLRRKKGKRKR
jgi:ABC-type Na+ transport system ATPase subunit NatA